MTKPKPVIFLLDLDGTLQGDIYPQVVEYELIRKLNQVVEKKVHYDTKKLFNDMSKGLIRPYVKEALIAIKEKHSNVEFFVYTASSDEWAKFLLPRIVHYLFGTKTNIINRPFLTRSDCLDSGKKSIEKVKPKIIKALRNKYDNLDNIYLVDNNVVLEFNEIERLILCPSYDFKVVNCPMRNLHEHYIETYHNLISKELFGTSSKNHLELLKLYYDNAFKEYVNTEERNTKFIHDNYWYQFENVLKSSKLNTQANVHKAIQKLQVIQKNNHYLLLLNKIKQMKSNLNINTLKIM